MPLIAGLVLFIQCSFAWHALKKRRPYWWIGIIMGFPVMGCVIYFFVVIFPGSSGHRAARNTVPKQPPGLQPGAELKRRVAELAACGSFDNKIALARQCSQQQMHAEAVSLYESCLATFTGDGHILYLLAQAAVEGGYWDKAAVAMARLKADFPAIRPLEVCLLEARVLEERGDNDAALAAYRDLIPAFIGLEARYRYGDLLRRLGQHEAADLMFNDILQQAKRMAVPLASEAQWVSAARKAIGHS